MAFLYPNNKASVRDEHDHQQCPGWALCLAVSTASSRNGGVADTTIGIFMMCVVMAVNSWIVPFHSPVVKAGCIGELQKATFTGQSLIIFTAYC